MPTTSFDVIFRPIPNQDIRSFDPVEQDTLFRKPSIEERKPKVAGSVAFVGAELAPEGLTLEDLALGYTELEERLEQNLDVITSRSKDLTYTIKPEEAPDLAEAISAIFKGVFGFITFDMYRKALELDRDLAILLGEAEHGLT